MRSMLLALGIVASSGFVAPPTTVAAAAELPRRGVLGAALVDDAGAVMVKAVLPATAAAAAGVQAGDVVRSVAGAPATNAADVVQTVRRTPAGTTITVVLVRNGVERTVSVTVGAPPSEDDPAVRTLYQTVTVQGSLRRTPIFATRARATRSRSTRCAASRTSIPRTSTCWATASAR